MSNFGPFSSLFPVPLIFQMSKFTQDTAPSLDSFQLIPLSKFTGSKAVPRPSFGGT